MKQLANVFLSLFLSLCCCCAQATDITLSNELRVYAGSSTIILTVPVTRVLTFNCGDHGSIMINGIVYKGTSSVIATNGDTIVATVLPFDGYYFDTITASDVTGVSMDGGTLTISNIMQDYTFVLTFEPIPPAVPELIPADAVLAPDMELTFTVSNLPQGALVTWQIVDTAVATVDDMGTVHANDYGSTSVTASLEDTTLVGSVTVRDLNTITLPGMLTTVETEVMMNNKMVENVVLSSRVNAIEARAFAGCTNLRFISIPPSVISIGEDCFKGCSNLVIICSENSAAQAYAIANDIRYQIAKE